MKIVGYNMCSQGISGSSQRPVRSFSGVLFQETKSGLLGPRTVARFYSQENKMSVKIPRAIQFFEYNGGSTNNLHQVKILEKGSEPKSVFVNEEDLKFFDVKGSGNSHLKLGFAGSLWDAVGNFSAIFRNGFWLENRINPDLGITQGIGYTSAVSMFSGPIRIHEAKLAYKTSRKIHDFVGRCLALVGGLRGALDVFTGISMAGCRTFSIIAASKASKLVTTASNVFGYLATSFASATFIIHVGKSLRSFIVSCRALKELNNRGIPHEALLSLTSKICLENPSITLNCDDKYEALKKILKAPLVSEEDKALLTDTEKNADLGIDDSIFDGLKLSKDETESKKENFKLAELIKLKKRKLAEFERVYGSEALKIILSAKKNGVKRDETQLLHLDVKSDVSDARLDAKEIVDLVKSQLRRKIFTDAIVFIGSLAGVISVIMTTVYSGGANLLIGYILMMVMNVLLTAIDTNELVNRIKNMDKVDNKQKMLLVLFSVLTIAISVVGCYFAGDTKMFKVALTASVIMISMQVGGTLFAWNHRKEVTENNENGKLDNELESIDSAPIETDTIDSQPGITDGNTEQRLSRRVSSLYKSRKRFKSKNSGSVSVRSIENAQRGRSKQKLQKKRKRSFAISPKPERQGLSR
jgi:hypothetical protein